MANIRVDLEHEIIDGQPVAFAAPCNCNAVTGLKVYHPNGSQVFTFRDAHGNDLTGLGNLFSNGAYVKALLDTKNNHAYLQNADTNAYLEAQLASKRPNTWNPDFLNDTGNSGYRNGLMYSGTPTKPLYVAVWDSDDSADSTKPNRRVRSAEASQVLALIGAASSVATNLGKVTSEDALNTALATVYDAMTGTETKMVTWTYHPLSSDWRWFGILSKSSANNGSLIAHSAYGGGSKIIKQKYNGAWQDCEWENPQMWPDTEYRTTERYDGKPVYVKRIVKTFSNTTIGAASGYSDYDIVHGITGLHTLVRVSGTLDNRVVLPYVAGAGGHTFLLQDTGTAIRLRIYCDTWSSPTVSVTMYYTK